MSTKQESAAIALMANAGPAGLKTTATSTKVADAATEQEPHHEKLPELQIRRLAENGLWKDASIG